MCWEREREREDQERRDLRAELVLDALSTAGRARPGNFTLECVPAKEILFSALWTHSFLGVLRRGLSLCVGPLQMVSLLGPWCGLGFLQFVLRTFRSIFSWIL